MYNVEPYVAEFLESLVTQSIGLDQLQIILVDDGSTDGTAAVAEDFARRHGDSIMLIRKENGGQASARNEGLRHATGQWVTFPDPDDVLDHRYFEVVSHGLADAAHHGQEPAIVSTRLLMWYEETGKVKKNHALDLRFRSGARIVDLDESPDWIQPHATSGFFRRDIIRRAELTFPENLRLRFEDTSFVSRYLLNTPRPVVQFLPAAKYLYRQRADSSSTIQKSANDPRKYVDTIEVGFRGVIEEAMTLKGAVPRWAQNIFLYDQYWILKSSQSAAVRNAEFPDAMYERLKTLVPEYLQHVDDDLILNFRLMPVTPWMREALWLVKHGSGHSVVYRGPVDSERGLASLVYRYVGDTPDELLLIGPERTPASAIHVKDQGLEYVGRPIVWQRTIWVPDDVVVLLTLNGVPIHQIHDAPRKLTPAFELGSTSIRGRTWAGSSQRILTRAGKAARRRFSRGGLALVRRDLAVHSRYLARRFADAWVFIDRDNLANDSAEDLYWWVRDRHPEVNAWFVLRRDSPDWPRMNAAGARLVEYGTAEFYALLIHAQHLASSHADRFVTHALPRKYRPGRYKFTFLQHGVIKGDISSWLNGKQIDLFVTSTRDEFEYITSPSPFKHGTKEVRLTGLPRFDVLQSRSEATPDEKKDLVVVMPTWRNYLVSGMGKSSGDRNGIDDFLETEYAKRFSELLGALAVHPSVIEAECTILFMPHPNMGVYLPSFPLPDGVAVASYDDVDVRDVLTRARMLITDYSSMAFNAAYIRLPMAYFQFDRDEYFVGHTERPGYFKYERDGFGPVCDSVPQVVSAVESALRQGMTAEYAERVDRTFPVRDGRNRERVFEAMLDITRRAPLRERVLLRSATPNPSGT